MNILFISHTAMGGSFVVGSHHLAREMAHQGHNVAHISSPVTPAHLLLAKSDFMRRKLKRCIRGGDLIDDVLDIVPMSLAPWKLVGSSEFLRRKFFTPISYVRRTLQRHGFSAPELIVVDEPRLVELGHIYPHARMIYRPTDLYAEIRADTSINEVERGIVRSGRFSVLAMSRPIADHMRKLGAVDVEVMENGVDYDFFSNPQILPHSPELPAGPRVVYVGALDRRFSLDHVLVAAESCPAANFILFGPIEGGLLSKVARCPNVHLMGPIQYRLLPAILQQCDVALLPLSEHPANAGRSPMKIYEYGAAGLPVVATSTPELEARGLPFVSLCETAQDFSAAIQLKLTELATVGRDRTSIQHHASKHSWKRKAQVLLELAGEGVQ